MRSDLAHDPRCCVKDVERRAGEDDAVDVGVHRVRRFARRRRPAARCRTGSSERHPSAGARRASRSASPATIAPTDAGRITRCSRPPALPLRPTSTSSPCRRGIARCLREIAWPGSRRRRSASTARRYGACSTIPSSRSPRSRRSSTAAGSCSSTRASSRRSRPGRPMSPSSRRSTPTRRAATSPGDMGSTTRCSTRSGAPPKSAASSRTG